MGNCCCVNGNASRTWADDYDEEEWQCSYESVSRTDSIGVEHGPEEEVGKKLNTEVKIRITKKELAKVLNRDDVTGFTAADLLSELMSCREEERHWRPNLQSIPEMAEKLR